MAAAVARASKLTQAQALELLTSGQSRVIRRNLTLEVGRHMMQQLQSLGIAALLQPSLTDPATPRPMTPPAGPQGAELVDVLLTGKTFPGVDVAQAAQNLVKLCK